MSIRSQAKTLARGRTGCRFGDYWGMDLSLEELILVVRVPMVLSVWPLQGRLGRRTDEAG